MKTNDFLPTYSYYKNQLREIVTKSMLANMTAQNIEPYISKYCDLIQVVGITRGIRLIPKTDLDAQQFEKLVRKFSRFFNKKPQIEIDDKSLEATWWLSDKWMNNDIRFRQTVWIELNTNNMEKCDIEYVDKIVKRPVLTGYCKELAERDYAPRY